MAMPLLTQMNSQMFQKMIDTTKERIEHKRNMMQAVEQFAQAYISLLELDASNLEAELKNLEIGLDQVKMAESGLVGGRIIQRGTA